MKQEPQIKTHIYNLYYKKLKKFEMLGTVTISKDLKNIEMTPGTLLDLYRDGFYGNEFENVRINLEEFLCKVDNRDNFQFSLALMYTLN